MKLTESRIQFGPRTLRCPYCHEGVLPSDSKAGCTACMAWQHEACWEESGASCAACGVALEARPTAEPRSREPRAWAQGLSRAWERVDLVFVLATAIWTVAGLLVGSALAAWMHAAVLLWIGAALGLAIGVVGGLVLLPPARQPA